MHTIRFERFDLVNLIWVYQKVSAVTALELEPRNVVAFGGPTGDYYDLTLFYRMRGDFLRQYFGPVRNVRIVTD